MGRDIRTSGGRAGAHRSGCAFTASAFYRVLNGLSDIEIPTDTGEFRLIDAKVAGQLRNYREQDRFLRGMVAEIGFRQNIVLSSAGVLLMVEVPGWDQRIAPLVATVLAVPISYAIARTILVRPMSAAGTATVAAIEAGEHLPQRPHWRGAGGRHHPLSRVAVNFTPPCPLLCRVIGRTIFWGSVPVPEGRS